MADLAAGLSATTPGTSVAPAPPVSLAAAAVSSSQINLTWTGSAGASGYLVERSTGGTSVWTQVGSTPVGTTSYQDSGLAAGTTYVYRVRAAGSGTDSAYSNTASATTTGTAVTAGSTTLWSNTFTPYPDSYSSGSYELGVKFRTDVAGTVTGLRFYKQSWMNGYIHVGHLWTSTGTLLATATFTGETASGWEQVTLSKPVPISAGTVYIASFSSGGGYFGISTSFFNGQGVDSGPVHALANGVAGGDGVYQSGNGSFPSVSGNGMNFWADVVFTPTAPAVVSAAMVSPRSDSPSPVAVAAPTNVATAASKRDAPTDAARPSTVIAGTRPYRGTVPQTQTPWFSRAKGSVDFGLLNS